MFLCEHECLRSFLRLVIYFSSPLQDDFIVLHIPGEYDSVLETVFKTEFLTLLSSKYQDSLSRQLKVDITSRYDDKFKVSCARCPFNCIVSQNTDEIDVVFLYLLNRFDKLLKLIFLETGHSCTFFQICMCMCY